MVKTQVQIPDRLYREAKRIAEENELSFAEVVRRGIEHIVRHFPAGRRPPSDWLPPRPRDLGAPLAPETDWTELSHG
ncbi:MAG: antitoxin [Acidobacteria bacterium]|nr:antitoxin [Acidobacteriota bacterium]